MTEDEIYKFFDFMLGFKVAEDKKAELLVEIVNNVTGERILNLNYVVAAASHGCSLAKISH